MKKMKAIVTGSNGFIGYNICQALARDGWAVMGIDDLSSGRKDYAVDGCRYEIMQVQQREKMQRCLEEMEPDVVFHLAAMPRVSYSVENPFVTAEANVMGTISIMEGIVKAGLVKKTRMVSTSSSAVYGNTEKLPTSEDDPCHPQTPYALEKYQGESWGRLFAELYGLDVVSLRYFNVFGPFSLFGGAYSTVLSAWLYQLFVDTDYQAFIEGDGKQSRDFCFVGNVVLANRLAAQASGRFVGEAFNIGQGEAYTLLKCQNLLEAASGRALELERRPPRVGDVRHTLADISRAAKVLGYEPDKDFESQVAAMAAWYRDAYPGD